MTRAFEKKIEREGVVDAKNYPYAVKYTNNSKQIVRLPIKSLDTTAAYWEIVKEYK